MYILFCNENWATWRHWLGFVCIFQHSAKLILQTQQTPVRWDKPTTVIFQWASNMEGLFSQPPECWNSYLSSPFELLLTLSLSELDISSLRGRLEGMSDSTWEMITFHWPSPCPSLVSALWIHENRGRVSPLDHFSPLYFLQLASAWHVVDA